mgnify:CR=1 FL=1
MTKMSKPTATSTIRIPPPRWRGLKHDNFRPGFVPTGNSNPPASMERIDRPPAPPKSQTPRFRGSELPASMGRIDPLRLPPNRKHRDLGGVNYPPRWGGLTPPPAPPHTSSRCSYGRVVPKSQKRDFKEGITCFDISHSMPWAEDGIPARVQNSRGNSYLHFRISAVFFTGKPFSKILGFSYLPPSPPGVQSIHQQGHSKGGSDVTDERAQYGPGGAA